MEALIGERYGLMKVIGVMPGNGTRMEHRWRLKLQCDGCDNIVTMRMSVARAANACFKCAHASELSYLPRHPTVSLKRARARMKKGWSEKAALEIPRGAKVL